MNAWLKYGLLGFILSNVVLCAWSVLHNDIYYYTDIGRDFLIFEEIATKKYVLFGPRADMQGLFHGILWHYLNVPAYILGNGNPVMVGWFWIALIVGFFASVYAVIKKLFDQESALLATALVSASTVQISQGLFHGNGAMIIMPLFFYTFVRYLQTKSVFVLFVHLITVGMLVQFEIAVGVPLALLSCPALLYFIVKHKKWKHIVGFLALVPFAATFILIELKYNFLQFRSFANYLQGARDNAAHTPFVLSLIDRIRNVGTHGVNIVQDPLHAVNIVFFALLLGAIYLSFKKVDKQRYIYLSFLYFYVGYYILTLLHGGYLIKFWWLPMSILPIMMIATIQKYFVKPVFLALLIMFMSITTYQNLHFITTLNNQRGNDFHSWQFHYQLAMQAIENAPQEFGYFIYAPDIYGYQDKYAFFYANKKRGHGVPFEKRLITYVFSEPPPKDFTGHDIDWWVSEKLQIKTQPLSIRKLKGDYEVRTYLLGVDDLKIPSQITPSDWLFYR